MALPPPRQRPTTARAQRVRCPHCRLLLQVPQGAAVFRCPCGRKLRAPNADGNEAAGAAAAGGGSSSGGGGGGAANTSTSIESARAQGGDEIIVTGLSAAAAAQLLQAQGSRRWIKQADSERNLKWYRVLTDDDDEDLKELEEDIMENLGDMIKDCDTEELKRKIRNLGLDPTNYRERKEVEELMFSAPEIVRAFDKREIVRRLDKLGADHRKLGTTDELARRLFVAAWEGGQGKAAEGSFVRMFNDKGTLDWVPATEFKFTTGDMSGSLVTPRDLELVSLWPFAKKLEWFRVRVDQLRVKWEDGNVRIKVFRKQLLRNAFDSFTKLKPADFHRFFRFEFIGEPAVDAGGVAREWFQLVADDCFNVDFGLFEYSGVDNLAYQINTNSGIANDLHLKYFHFLGQVLGKALFDNHVINAHMTRPLYKHLLAMPISSTDLEFVDPQIARSVENILECENVSDLYLDFTTAVRVFGETQVVELKPGGEDIDVTNENRHEYVEALTRHIMLDRINAQLAEFLSGCYDVVPHALMSVFDHQELELVLCGVPTIDVDDWKKNTRYRGAYAASKERHKVVKWFWDFIAKLDETMRARFLQFVTGTSRVPVQGFAALQGNDGNIKTFCIDSVPFNQCIYPKAHTCFNRIELPIYPTKNDLETYVLQAIQVEITGFGIE